MGKEKKPDQKSFEADDSGKLGGCGRVRKKHKKEKKNYAASSHPELKRWRAPRLEKESNLEGIERGKVRAAKAIRGVRGVVRRGVENTETHQFKTRRYTVIGLRGDGRML